MQIDSPEQYFAFYALWRSILAGFTEIYNMIQSSFILQLIFLVTLIETGAIIVKFLKKEDSDGK